MTQYIIPEQESKKADALLESFADQIYMDASKHAFKSLTKAIQDMKVQIEVTNAFVAEVFMIKALYQLQGSASLESAEAQNDKQKALNTLRQQEATILKYGLSREGSSKAKVCEALYALTKKAIEESRTRPTTG